MIKSKIVHNNNGFTLLELLTTVVLATIISSIIYATYQNQQNLHRQQEAVVDMQQNSRAAIYLIGQELRMAGFDPLEAGGMGIQPGANSTTIQYLQDLNQDGDANDPNENTCLGFRTQDTWSLKLTAALRFRMIKLIQN